MQDTMRAGRGRLARKRADLAMSALAVLIVGGLHGQTCTGSASAGPPTAPAANPDPEQELRRRDDELVKQGFAFTQGVTFGGAESKRIELWIPAGDEQTIALWFEAEHGDASLRWLDPGGEVVTAWRGRRIEQRMTRRLAPGKHVLELGASGGRVHGLIGVNGPTPGSRASTCS
jgi:hypothetical protein